jgi:general stress protein CsbA
MIGSAVALAVGGVLLFGVVPLALTIGTYAEVALLIVTAHFYPRKLFKYLAVILNALLFATLFSPAHISAYERFGQDAWITALDIFSFLAFGVFPILFFASYFASRGK